MFNYIKNLLFLYIIFIYLLLFINNNFKITKYNPDKEIKINIIDKINNLENTIYSNFGITYSEFLLKNKYNLNDIELNYNKDFILYDDITIYINKKDLNKISINNANIYELITLPGIGDKTAKYIIEYRENFGMFYSIEELMNVKGIGIKKYEKIKDLISI